MPSQVQRLLTEFYVYLYLGNVASSTASRNAYLIKAGPSAWNPLFQHLEEAFELLLAKYLDVGQGEGSLLWSRATDELKKLGVADAEVGTFRQNAIQTAFKLFVGGRLPANFLGGSATRYASLYSQQIAPFRNDITHGKRCLKELSVYPDESKSAKRTMKEIADTTSSFLEILNAAVKDLKEPLNAEA